MDITDTIYLITTEGCEGCRIAKNILEKAIIESKIKLIYLQIDVNDKFYYDFIKSLNVSDFPTIVFTRNHKILETITGTTTVDKLVKRIQKHFK